MGAETKGLMDALLAVQRAAPKLQKDAINPHFKSRYMSLDSIVEKAMPLLSEHGLVWTTLPCRDVQGEPALRYRMIHAESGEELSETMPLLLAKPDPQGQGSAITYARRYSLVAVLNLVADEDDDGNAGSASSGNGNGARRGAVTARPPQDTERMASAPQRRLINGKAAEKNLPPSMLANIVNAAAEAELREFESQSAAEDWLRRSLDRLPARLVEPILEGIAKTEAVES